MQVRKLIEMHSSPQVRIQPDQWRNINLKNDICRCLGCLCAWRGRARGVLRVVFRHVTVKETLFFLLEFCAKKSGEKLGEKYSGKIQKKYTGFVAHHETRSHTFHGNV